MVGAIMKEAKRPVMGKRQQVSGLYLSFSSYLSALPNAFEGPVSVCENASNDGVLGVRVCQDLGFVGPVAKRPTIHQIGIVNRLIDGFPARNLVVLQLKGTPQKLEMPRCPFQGLHKKPLPGVPADEFVYGDGHAEVPRVAGTGKRKLSGFDHW